MKHQLKVEYENDCLLYGLVCQEQVHRLCWFLNRKLKIDLAFYGEHQAVNKKSTTHHAHYKYLNEGNLSLWRLVENRDEGQAMLPEYKNLDYFLIVEEHDHVDEIALLRELKEIPILLGCYYIEQARIKSLENLIFE